MSLTTLNIRRRKRENWPWPLADFLFPSSFTRRENLFTSPLDRHRNVSRVDALVSMLSRANRPKLRDSIVIADSVRWIINGVNPEISRVLSRLHDDYRLSDVSAKLFSTNAVTFVRKGHLCFTVPFRYETLMRSTKFKDFFFCIRAWNKYFNLLLSCDIFHYKIYTRDNLS